jgi:hypothetical protein
MSARRCFTLVAALLALALASGAAAAADTCVECHKMFDEARLSDPVRGMEHDVHTAKGFSCVSCHGGDAADEDLTAMDPSKGFRALKRRGDVAEMCARCHANAAFMKRYNPRPYVFSVDEYRTSVHCKREAEGDQKVATCTNCHGVHGILSPKDPASPVYPSNVPHTCAKCHNPEYMKGRTTPGDEYPKYSTSVHGIALLEKKDLSAPACNDCHGNHGAAPPGLQDITLVCGTCHGREAELFAKSPMQNANIKGKKPNCVVCHSNHAIHKPTDAMLSTGPDGVCGTCHEKGSFAESATHHILARIDSLRASLGSADSLLEIAERKGMETGHARDALREARDQSVAVRAALHSFDAKVINDLLDASSSLAFRAEGAGHQALRDWRQRRIGMAASLVAILIVITLLSLKIREMERGAKKS